MINKLRAATSPAMIVAVIALVFATTGGAYAATRLIGGKDIRNGSIGLADLSGAARRALRGRQGPSGERGTTGPQGAAGPTGATGPAGPAGLAGVQAVDGASKRIPSGGADGAPTANCPAGKVVIGTGFNASIGWAGFVKAYGTFVGGFFLNDSSIDVDVSVQAICASTGGAVAASARPGRSAFERDVREAQAALRQRR
ncbi:collagen-like protein [Conexibacter woesei]|uniref:Collagen triple helix repeat protein n=1 Tax=Conexibacter woesei (strain DSM 14684 / CCUG 47730 / CIP 108061 / JCM 11494 / NBRC 100937 / ID131577) TaxID=469383 RepID=D3FDH7_CONWI|nr:collagen-like protein [Conexibacter woesei]ADB49551.1 hypothetical protein Cwoe_1120 [Conexibacter woesei DSM 14684]